MTDRYCFGTYTGAVGREDGLVLLGEPKKGEQLVHTASAPGRNPWFLYDVGTHGAILAAERYDSTGRSPGRNGWITSYRLDEESGHLKLLSRQTSEGVDPCNICTDPSGEYVFAANHGSGTVAVLPLARGATLGPVCQLVEHSGSGPRKAQDGPHPHFVGFDRAKRFLLVCDKGTDNIVSYRFTDGRLKRNQRGGVKTRPGAGPRHLCFSQDGESAYVANEQDSTVSWYSYEPEWGRLRLRQTRRTLPPGVDASGNLPSEILLHPDGGWLLVGNRGHGSIAVYQVETTSGRLREPTFLPCDGRRPRHFAFDSSGDRLVVAGQDTGSISLYEFNSDSGEFPSRSHVARLRSPVYVLPLRG